MRRDRRHQLTALYVVVALVVALGLRVGDVETTHYRAINDAGTYSRFAASVATDGDYTTGDNGPATGAGDSRGPTAYFPPAYSYVLSIADLIDGHVDSGPVAVPAERLENAAIGTVTVALVGLLALEMVGMGPALAALGLAAIYPPFIELSSVLAAENLLVCFELAAVWAALRARGSPHPWRWVAATGLLVGLATLSHENGAVMLIALSVPAAGAVSRCAGRRRIVRGGAAVALLWVAAAVMISPWTIRNALQLHHFIPVSDETGITLRGTYNPVSAADCAIPWKWHFFWRIPADHDLRVREGSLSELTLSQALEHRAVLYIGAHPSAPLEVGWDNLKRMFELEGSAAWRASTKALDIPVDDARIGVFGFWAMCVLGLLGLGTRAARAAPRSPWLVPVLFALSVVFVNVETPRFREPIDPFGLVLAGCAVSAALARLRSSRP